MVETQLTLQFEEWRPLPGYEEAYEISSFGRIRRIGHGSNRYPVGHLHSFGRIDGYLSATLTKNGMPKKKLVHRLVMEAFSGPCPEGKEVNHKNGIRTDARLSNLEYVTRTENIRHQRDVLGTLIPSRARGDRHPQRTMPERMAHGERVSTAKLTESLVRQIREMLRQGMSGASIARTIGFINYRTVSRIKLNQIWRHVV